MTAQAVTAEELRQAATQQYQATMAQAQALEATEQATRAATAEERRKEALEVFEQIASDFSSEFAHLRKEVAAWARQVEAAEATLLAAYDQGVAHRAKFLEAVSQFAQEAVELADDVPPAELQEAVAQAVYAATGDARLEPRLNFQAHKNLKRFAGWGDWLSHADARTTAIAKVFKQKGKDK